MSGCLGRLSRSRRSKHRVANLVAGLLLVGARMFKPQGLLMVARTGPAQAAVMAVTFALTIVIPMQYAVIIGLAISVILFVVEQSELRFGCAENRIWAAR